MMGRKKAGQEQLCDHIARNKSRAKKSAEKVVEKLKGKRMMPDPSRKGCYIYVDAEPVDQGSENIGLDFESGEIVAVWDIGLCPEEFQQENDSVELVDWIVNGQMGLGVDVKDVVDELNYVKQMGPSFGAYPVGEEE